jgi:hypothetical protein
MTKRNLTAVSPPTLRIEDLPNITKDENGFRVIYTGKQEEIMGLGIYPKSVFPIFPKRKKTVWRDPAGKIISEDQAKARWKGAFYTSPNHRQKFEPIFVERIKGGSFQVQEIKTIAQREAWEKEEERKRWEIKTKEQYVASMGKFIHCIVDVTCKHLPRVTNANPKGFFFKNEKAAIRKMREAAAIIKNSEVGISRKRIASVPQP